ncbi:MAG: HEAT repeat domain-containing protein [Actinomycetota bacterium]|nr:HEAT repeat domain-containing protein [Actinomycetota bacterium]
MNNTISNSSRPLHSDFEPLLKQVNIALKCLQLYPANHATTKSAIDKLWFLLSEYFNHHEYLGLMIKRDALLIDGQPVGSTSPGMKSLALQLYRLKLDRLSIRADIDRSQLVDFLMIACMDADDVFKAGGVTELLWQKQMRAITVSHASLKLDQAAEPGNEDIASAEYEIDLTAYKSILSKDALSEPERQLIKRHLEQGPEQLSDFLQKLGDVAHGMGGASAIYTNALPKIYSVIKRELADEQTSLYSNLKEALSLLKEPVWNELNAMLSGGSLEGAEDKTSARINETAEPAPVESANAAKIAEQATAVDQQDFARIEKESAEMNKALVEKGALAALSEVLAMEIDASRLAYASSAVQRLLFSAFKEQRLDVATDALAIIINEMSKRADEPENYSILKEIVRNAGDQSKIATLLSRLENQANPQIGQAVEYITLIGNTGVLTLLDMLAVEKSQGRRRLLCRVLADCGQADIAGLGSKIMDHRWYLVRNVVSILGQIGGANAAEYLQKTTSHPDPRVRSEAVKASSSIGPPAIPVILSLLRDKDLNIQLEAIRAIANISHPSVLEILIGLVKESDFFRRRVDVKIEAIRALGRLRAEQSIRHLSKIAGARAMFFRAKQARLAGAAANALLQIEASKNGV